MKRRDFLTGSAAAGLSLAAAATSVARQSANDRIAVAVIGVGGRGNQLLKAFASQPDVDVKYVCDVDENRLRDRTEAVEKQTGRRPEAIVDFRRAIDDAAVDAVVLGTPTHWHAIPTIAACRAGKDVYVEKPDAHNAVEGRVMIEAARKYKRVVQQGTHCRSASYFRELMEFLSTGAIGRPLLAKGWESARQRSLGHPADGDPPAGVNYDLWLGPAPKRPFNRLRFHGNWRWFFDYGAGDLGNDGVHRLDLAKWAFDAALQAAGQEPLGVPKAVSAHGGKCYFDDVQEWPDNLVATYDYGQGRVMTYEMRLWSPYPLEGEAEGAAVYGDKGYVIIGNNRWRAFAARGEPIRNGSGDYGAATVPHVRNFLDCMRARERPASDLETIGHPSSLLCHLGNAAWRAGRTLKFDPQTYTSVGDDDAGRYLKRPEYRGPWMLPKPADV